MYQISLIFCDVRVNSLLRLTLDELLPELGLWIFPKPPNSSFFLVEVYCAAEPKTLNFRVGKHFQAVPWWEDIKGPQKGDPSTRLPEKTIVHSRPNGLVSNLENPSNPSKSHDLGTFSFGLFLILYPKWQPFRGGSSAECG